jgi:integrase
MPEGACVIRYAGSRGVVWRIKYRDATGRQVKETLGRAAAGWTKRKAEAELRARLVDVEKDGYRKPEQVTFASHARQWLADYPEARGLKRSTRSAYETIVERHLIPAFGPLQLAEVTVDRIERHLAARRRDGLAPATLHRQLAALSLIMGAGARRGLMRANPVPQVERPRAERRRWRILSPAEVAAVEGAFDELITEAGGHDRDALLLARVLFLTLMGTGLRRGEALGLRWRHVLLADPDGPVLRVEETWVRAALDTPKSQAGHRTIALGPRLAGELFDHRVRSAFSGDDERAFCNPRTGRPLDPARFGDLLRQALERAGVAGYVRPWHDLRHSSITNAAAAGTPPEALMSRAGHSDYATTRRYVDLAGERFREEADRLERRLWGGSGTKNRYQVASPLPNEATEEAAIPLRD